MTDHHEEQLDRLFSALGDRTRRKMLLMLTKDRLSVSELGEPFGMTKQSVSKHLKVLEDAGLVNKHKDGRIQRCQFNMEKFAIVQTLIDQYKKHWEEQFDVLESFIANIKKEEKT
jgi:DNA-binding transcriptional ArsR family regulator